MKKTYPLLIMTFVAVLFGGSVDATDYGKFWLDLLSESERLAYSKGFLEGYMQGYTALAFDMNIVSAGSPQQKEIFKQKLNEMHNLKIDVVKDIVNQFYQDPANRLIYPQFLCEIAIRKLMGASKAEIEKILERARRIAVEKKSN
jgi:hypothetical protein